MDNSKGDIIIEAFNFFFNLLKHFLSDFSISLNHLIGVLRIIYSLIYKIGWKLEPYFNDFVNTIFTFAKVKKALIFDEILNLLSLLCQKYNRLMVDYQNIIFQIIHFGFISQSPIIINGSSLLLADYIKFVNNDQSSDFLIVEIFNLFEETQSELLDMISSSLITSVSYIILSKLQNFPSVYIDKFFNIVDCYLNKPINKYNKSNVQFATNIFSACFLAYVSFYKLKSINGFDLSLLNFSKQFLNKYPQKCYLNNSYDKFTIFNLCKLLKEIGNLFKMKINITLNNKYIKKLLSTKIDDIDYSKEFKETIKFIENIH